MDTKILTCVALFAGTSSLTGQVTSPADSANVLLDAAESFESDGRWDVAEALYRFIAEHFDTTPASFQARTRFLALNRVGAEGSGSVELRVWATTFGLWLGVAVPAWLDADQPEPYGAGLLLGGPAGYFGGKVLAESLDLTEGQARAVTLGGTWGTWQGFGWAEVLELGGQENCFRGPCFDSGPSDEARFGAMVIGGLSGIAARGSARPPADISRSCEYCELRGALGHMVRGRHLDSHGFRRGRSAVDGGAHRGKRRTLDDRTLGAGGGTSAETGRAWSVLPA